MEVPIFEAELRELLLKDDIVTNYQLFKLNKLTNNKIYFNILQVNEDFFDFIKRLYMLTMKIRMIKKPQNPYVLIAKNWVAAFQVAFYLIFILVLTFFSVVLLELSLTHVRAFYHL